MTDPTTSGDRGPLDPVPEAERADAARRLSDQAEPHLIAAGYSDAQIRSWAEEYVSRPEANIDLRSFLTWVGERRG